MQINFKTKSYSLAGIEKTRQKEGLLRDKEDKVQTLAEGGVCQLWGYYRKAVRQLAMKLKSDKIARQL